MTDEFKIGDIVTRSNGSTDEMEVILVTADSIICLWYDDDGDPEKTPFNPWELRLVSRDGKPARTSGMPVPTRPTSGADNRSLETTDLSM